MIKIVFVCLGNICRSPLAQGIFEKKIRDKNLQNIYVDSAGVSSWHEGEKPHSGSLRVSDQFDLGLENQRSRPVSPSDRHEFDYFVAMDKSNARSLVQEFGIPAEKVLLMRDFDPKSPGADVPDPYGFDHNAFLNVYQILDRSMDQFIAYLIQKHPDFV